jgi:hypothetical protein
MRTGSPSTVASHPFFNVLSNRLNRRSVRSYASTGFQFLTPSAASCRALKAFSMRAVSTIWAVW